MKRRLIFINRFFWPDESATAQLLTDLSEHLSQSGFEVCIISGNRGYIQQSDAYPAEDTLGDIAIRRTRSSGAGRYNLILRVWDYALFYFDCIRILRRLNGPGSQIITLTDPPLVHFWIRLFFRNTPMIHWSMDVFPEIISQTTQSSWKRRLLYPLIGLRNWSLKNAKQVVGLHDEMQSFFQAPFTSIPNWSPHENTTVELDAVQRIRAQWKVADDEIVVGYSGNLGHLHDATTVHTALSCGAERPPKARFIMIGGGKRMGVFHTLSQSDAAVQCEAFVPREDTAHSLAAIDIHWLSLYPQFSPLAFPSKFAGICQAKRPMIFIGSPDCALGRIILDNAMGCVVENGDSAGFLHAVNRLAEDAELRRRMGLRAFEFYTQEFTQAKAFEKWKAVLQ